MMNILIVTCDDHVKLDQSDALFQAPLIEAGATVTVLPWRHASFWTVAADNDAVVIRSVWDYPAHLAEFKNWIAESAQRNIRVFNSPQLLEWNLDKHYLFELKRNGVHAPRTVSVKSADDLVAAFEDINVVLLACLRPGAASLLFGQPLVHIGRKQACFNIQRAGGAATLLGWCKLTTREASKQ